MKRVDSQSFINKKLLQYAICVALFSALFVCNTTKITITIKGSCFDFAFVETSINKLLCQVGRDTVNCLEYLENRNFETLPLNFDLPEL